MMKEKIEGGEKENKIYIYILINNNNIGPVFVKNTTSPINLTVTKSAKKKNVKVKISYGTEGWDHRWEKNEIVLYFLFIYLLKRERERGKENLWKIECCWTYYQFARISGKCFPGRESNLLSFLCRFFFYYFSLFTFFFNFLIFFCV